jgi:hypothetical protein
MERSEIRGVSWGHQSRIRDCASLHPGYADLAARGRTWPREETVEYLPMPTPRVIAGLDPAIHADIERGSSFGRGRLFSIG